MSVARNTIGLWFLRVESARSADLRSRCLISPQHPGANTVARRAARNAMRCGMLRSRQQCPPSSAEGRGRPRPTSASPSSARVASWRSLTASSAWREGQPQPRATFIEATAKSASRRRPSSGTGKTLIGLHRTDAAAVLRNMVLRWNSMKPCTLRRAACVPFATRMSPICTAGRDGSFPLRLTTVTKPDAFVGFCARSATAP